MFFLISHLDGLLNWQIIVPLLFLLLISILANLAFVHRLIRRKMHKHGHHQQKQQENKQRERPQVYQQKQEENERKIRPERLSTREENAKREEHSQSITVRLQKTLGFCQHRSSSSYDMCQVWGKAKLVEDVVMDGYLFKPGYDDAMKEKFWLK